MTNQEITQLSESLPPIIARDKIEELLGGVIRSKTLANYDSLGIGPKGRMRIGRKVAYRTGDLLEWIANRTVSLQ